MFPASAGVLHNSASQPIDAAPHQTMDAPLHSQALHQHGGELAAIFFALREQHERVHSVQLGDHQIQLGH